MSDDSIQFVKPVEGIGCFTLRSLRIPEDMESVHYWVTQPHAQFWGMQGYSVAQVTAGYREIIRTAEVFIGLCDDVPMFLMERYDPATDPVGKHYAVQAGDKGMHVLVAPADKPIANFTWSVFTVVMDFMFSDTGVARVVVEPDVRNDKIHVLNKRAGFVYQKAIELPTKTAHLAFCTRQQYQSAIAQDKQLSHYPPVASPSRAVAHLTPTQWALVNRLHLRKAISEFAHECLIEPVLQTQEGQWGLYQLTAQSSDIEYRFRAKRLSLDHWHIELDSLQKLVAGQEAALDSLHFIIEFKDALGIPTELLPTYLEEISSTLYSSAYKYAKPSLTAAQLTQADFQAVEAAMIEGHPTFVANNGRIGFDATDYRMYAPEAGTPLKLLWLAVHCSQTVFACGSDLSYQTLMQEELGEANLNAFTDILQQLGLTPSDYLFMPVHPWQWHNKLAMIFAPDIATRHIVYLGESTDTYQAQQSIRTFFNLTQPHKRYVKTALSILNMGFMRGLSPYYMSTTPAINDWLHGLIEHDRYLTAKGFSILREVAGIGYRNHYFEEAIQASSPYKKMLSALWRESPMPQLQAGQRLMTMASLLHVDTQGTALLPVLIQAAGLDISTWLERYFDCYLSPLLHCFYAHDLVFMPHGENLILVLENQVPIKAIMKDTGEEAQIMHEEVVLSEAVQRLAVHVPEEIRILSIFTDLFDCIFRYLADILLEQADYPEEQFWRLVAECILTYQQTHPELADKFVRYDLFVPEFTRSCLNRLQLSNNQQMIDLTDPAKNLKFVGTLPNPIARYKTLREETTTVDEISL